MLKPTYAVFGFLLLIAAIGSVTLVVGSDPPPHPQPSNLAEYLKEQMEIQRSIVEIIRAQSEKIERINSAISKVSDRTNSDETIASIGHQIADDVATIKALLSPSATPGASDVLPAPSPPSPTSIKGTGTVSISEPGQSAILEGCLFATLFLALFAVLFAYWGYKKTASTVGVLTAVALSGVTIIGVKFDKLFHIEFSFPRQIEGGGQEQSVTISVPRIQNKKTELDCGKADEKTKVNSYRISSFPDALASPPEIDGTHSDELNKAFDPLKSQIEKVADALALPQSGGQDRQNDLIAIFLVGSADRRDVFGTTRQSYSSNIGLAQARADWVQQVLKYDLKDDKRFQATPIITLNSGPTLFKFGNDVRKLADDRAVQICVLWDKNL